LCDRQTNINCGVHILSSLSPLHYMLLSYALTQKGELVHEYILKIVYQNDTKCKYLICIYIDLLNAKTII